MSSKSGTGLDVQIGVVDDQNKQLSVLVRTIKSSGRGGAVARRRLG